MKKIIGIDLGTTNSAASFFDTGEAVIIPNDRGSRITPSMAALTQSGEILVGEAAKNQSVINASGTISSVKRLMGKEEVIELLDRTFSPEEISSLILKKIKKDSETFLGTEIKETVITVPAYFNEKQRRATQEAGRLAGFRVLRILNEPTAAALAYASQIKKHQTVLVYDLGGGTFDVTVLKIEGGGYRVLSTTGDNHLGGIDFDQLLFERVSAKFSDQLGMDITEDPILRQQLLEQVERAKMELSSRETALIALPFVGGDRKAVHLSYDLGRNEFNTLIRPYIERTVALSLEAVEQAGTAPDGLIYSGGSSRIPLVRELMKSVIETAPLSRINPEEVVALGAAVQASILEKRNGTIFLQDITPLPLGVEIEGGEFVSLVKKNAPLPAVGKKVFTTISDDQTSVEIHILQGGNRIAEKNTSLGKLLLGGIKKAPRGVPLIEVAFEVDVNGILHVRAKDIDTGTVQKVSITRNYSTDSEDKVRDKIVSLSNRIEGLMKGGDGLIDSIFRTEIRNILKRSGKALLKSDTNELFACRVALETVINELNTILQNYEVRLGRA